MHVIIHIYTIRHICIVCDSEALHTKVKNSILGHHEELRAKKRVGTEGTEKQRGAAC